MKDPDIEAELKKRSPPQYNIKKDPVTGAEYLEEDTTATSFSYDTKEIERWIKEEAIPKDLATAHLQDIEESRKRYLAGREMVERVRKEGREPTIEDWQSLIPSFKPVTMEDLKNQTAFHTFLMENREKLLKILQQPSTKKRKFRKSGHFIDQKLKVSKTDILDSLTSETQEKMAERGIEVKTEGVKLSPPQDKLLTAMMKLLHEKSENKNEKSDQFYAGNCETSLVPYGGKGLEGRSATIRIYPSELYKAYLDSDDYSGADIKYIKNLLHDTEQQKFLITYERKYEIINRGKKEKRTDRIEDFQSLFKIISFFEGLTDDEARALDKGNEELRERRGELIIGFNPLLTDQINSKYVEFPEDINRRTVIACGGHRMVTESVIALRDYLLREISTKRKIAELNEETLIRTLKLVALEQAKRKSRIKSRIQSAIQAAKNLGLITHHERLQGASSQWKYIFHLNLDFLD